MAFCRHILDKQNFESFYEYQQSQKKCSFDIFLSLMEITEQKHDFNIMVGTSSTHENDLYRFGYDDNYSLHINSNQNKFTAERQNKMFTINWEDVDKYLYRLPKKFVNNIHFDTGVSYFTPINYLLMANHILKKNGKIIWDLENHSSCCIFYSSKTQKFYNVDNSEMSVHEVDNILDNDGITRIMNENNDNVLIPKNDNFFKNNKINPQMMWVIIDKDKNYKKCKTEPYLKFLEFCSKQYPNFTFETKYYSYADYTYPVPMRIQPHLNEPNNFMLATYSTHINFIVNEIMNKEEKHIYIVTKKLSVEKLIQLVDRIFININIKNLLLSSNVIPTNMLDICKSSDGYDDAILKIMINDYFYKKIFDEKYMFIEATKNF